ncbi:hypothetical protein LTS18_012376, partial [Coniosporium uncinatum]
VPAAAPSAPVPGMAPMPATEGQNDPGAPSQILGIFGGAMPILGDVCFGCSKFMDKLTIVDGAHS